MHSNKMQQQAPAADFAAIREFASPPQSVYAALVNADAITGWWVPTSGSGQQGGELRFRFGDTQMRSRVDVAEPSRRVSWTVLVCEPVPDWAGTTINFDLEPTGTGTVLRFVHVGLTPQLECFDMCQSGWTQYLSSLVEYVDNGAGSPFGSPAGLAQGAV